MKIYLIRHGMTIGNEQKRYTGQMDVDVSERGISELLEIKDNYKDIVHLPLYTSTLKRTLQTAHILFTLQNHKDSLSFMNETNFGDFEGKTYTDLKSDPDYRSWLNDIYNEIPKNGESFPVFKDRVINHFKTHVFSQSSDTIYVTHGGVIRMIMSTLVDRNRDFFDFKIPNGKGYEITINDGGFVSYKEL